MSLYHVTELMGDKNFIDARYYEFLRVKDMSAGIYRLAAGTEDLQKPHTEDEIYYVVEGEGKIFIENKDFEVRDGSIIYVPANAKHQFHSITKDLNILVIFAPAELSQGREGIT